ncbi:MAG: GtrA family protein [Bacteroidales bacterium]
MSNIFHRLMIFAKAQLSAGIGGATDYLVMILCTELFHVHYVISVIAGGVTGAVVNFLLNRRWAFHSKEVPYKYSGLNQFLKFTVVVVNSIILKASGTFLLTELLRFSYIISRLITDLFVSLGVNFVLQNFWVFRKSHPQKIIKGQKVH